MFVIAEYLHLPLTVRYSFPIVLQQASTLKPGEILVTRITSPAWTPLFALVAGLVLEEGGSLSHGAVVARECGVPCILQISQAMSRIRTGDLLLIDGAESSVTVL